jgi:molecular chaperone GrpE (heat shock protein)
MSDPKRQNLARRALDALAGRADPPDELARIARRLDALDVTLTALATHPAPRYDDQLGSLREAIAGVEKQVGRAGREQLKANALAEAQQEQARALLEELGQRDAQRGEDADALLARARLEVAQRTLPALDGIDEALRAGEELLERPLPARAPTLFERMRARALAPSPEELRLRDAVRAWLVGLTFVRQRMLDALAAEGIQPIAALGLAFDPTLHVALQVVPANGEEPGTVVAELRRGYTAGGRVLRHAEVSVAAELAREAS